MGLFFKFLEIYSMPRKNIQFIKFINLLKRIGTATSADCLKKLQETGHDFLQIIAELFGFVAPTTVVKKSDVILFILEWIKGKSDAINLAVIRNTPISEIELKLYQNIVSIIDRRLLRNALTPPEYVMLQKSFQKQHRMTLEEFFSGTKIILNGTREMQLVVHFHMIVQDATESIHPDQLLLLITRLNIRLQIFGDDYVIRSFSSGGVARLFMILAPYLKMFFETSMQEGAYPQFKILLAESYRRLHDLSVRFCSQFLSEGGEIFLSSPTKYGFPDSVKEYPEYLAAQINLLS
jgi:hypothetical protein